MKHASNFAIFQKLQILLISLLVAAPSACFSYEVHKNKFGYFISQVDQDKIWQVYPEWGKISAIADNVEAFLSTDPYEFGRDSTRFVLEQLQNPPGQIYCIEGSTKHPITQNTKPGAFGFGYKMRCMVAIFMNPIPIEEFDCVFWRDAVSDMFVGDYHACYVQFELEDQIVVASIYLPKLPDFDKFYSMDIISLSGSTLPYYRKFGDIGRGVVLGFLSRVDLLAETPVSFKGSTLSNKVPYAISGNFAYNRPNKRYNNIRDADLFVVK